MLPKSHPPVASLWGRGEEGVRAAKATHTLGVFSSLARQRQKPRPSSTATIAWTYDEGGQCFLAHTPWRSCYRLAKRPAHGLEHEMLALRSARALSGLRARIRCSVRSTLRKTRFPRCCHNPIRQSRRCGVVAKRVCALLRRRTPLAYPPASPGSARSPGHRPQQRPLGLMTKGASAS